MAAKILLVGSVMMDLILRCERAPEPSESVLGHDYRNAPGGKGNAPQWPPPAPAPRFLLMPPLAMMPMVNTCWIAGKRRG